MVALAYDIDGYDIDGDAGAPTLLLGPSLGTDARMWQPQVDALRRHFRVVRFDHRGHGRSPVPAGDYALADLGQDVLALLDRLGVATASYAGVSLGGMVGMWLAANAPERVHRLALVCTSAYLPPASGWRERASTVRAGGMAPVADAVAGRWFTPEYQRSAPATVAAVHDILTGTDPQGYAGCCASIAGMDLRPDLPRIGAPTLVISAAGDESTPPEHGREIAAGVPGARYELVAGAHLANIENPAAVTSLLLAHLAARSPGGHP